MKKLSDRCKVHLSTLINHPGYRQEFIEFLESLESPAVSTEEVERVVSSLVNLDKIEEFIVATINHKISEWLGDNKKHNEVV